MNVDRLESVSSEPRRTPSVLGILGICFVVISVVSYLHTLYRLRHFKGPFLAVTSKFWMLKCTYYKNAHWEFKRVCDEYGSIARISPTDLITDNVELILRMSAVRSPYTKSDFYSGTQYDLEVNHIFSETNESRHLDLRHKLSSGYSGKENPYLEQSVDDRTLELIKLMENNYLSSNKIFIQVDFARIAQFFTLDVISEVAFGAPLGFLKRNEDINGYCHIVEETLPAFELAAVLPTLNRFVRLPIVRKFVMPTAEDRSGVGMLMGFAKKLVAKRFGKDKEERQDMLGSFVKHGLTQREAETEATFQIMAGSDTTVTAIRATILYVVTNPQVYYKLRQELDDAHAAGRLTQPIAADRECRSLPYLLACIRESLRLWPPSFALVQKVAPPEGDTIDGQFIPGGTRIATCAWGVLRSKKVFGDDADVYRPERWLESSEEDLLPMKRSADLLFGSGRYQCLGRSLALMELRKVLSTLLFRYDLTLVDPTRPWKSAAANGTFMQSEMFMKIEPRERSTRRSER